MSQDTWDDNDLDDFLGRYEIHMSAGMTIKLDTCTGDTWILRAGDAKALWVPMSQTGGKS
jgi:hypothetical protein